MVDTKIVVQPRGGGAPHAELQAEIITYGFRLGRPGSISLALAMGLEGATRANLDPGRHELAVVRNRETVWVGPLLTVSEDDSARKLDLGGEGLLHYPGTWHVTSDLTFAGIDQALILKALLDHHQDKAGGDFGLDTSTLAATGVTRDRTYRAYERKNIGEAAEQLADLSDGFHLQCRPSDRALIAHYPRQGRRRPGTVFDERNIRKFTRTIDATSQASQVLATGTGTGADTVLASRQDSNAVATYGLTQAVVVDKDVILLTTLSEKADFELASRALVPNSLRLVVSAEDLFTWGLDDEVKVVWPSEYDPVDEFQRVVGFDVTYQGGEELAVLFTEPLS